MNRLHLFLLVSLVLCCRVFADNGTARTHSKIFPIGARDADRFYDQTMTVTGKVAQVTIRPKVVFLNLDKAFPNTPFTGVIFSANTNGFKDVTKLKGKSVEITGKIKNYQDKPEIVLTNASQLKVIEPDRK